MNIMARRAIKKVLDGIILENIIIDKTEVSDKDYLNIQGRLHFQNEGPITIPFEGIDYEVKHIEKNKLLAKGTITGNELKRNQLNEYVFQSRINTLGIAQAINGTFIPYENTTIRVQGQANIGTIDYKIGKKEVRPTFDETINIEETLSTMGGEIITTIKTWFNEYFSKMISDSLK